MIDPPEETTADDRTTMRPWRGETLIMGIVNVTPDSFSDGGQWLDPVAAIDHGFALVDDGADMLDVGAESTRPGFEPVTPAQQISRLKPVVERLAEAGVPLSVDTRSAEVASMALACGATIVNDVSGGQYDPAMLPLVAAAGVDFVCQSWRRPDVTSLRGVGSGPFDELLWRRDACLDAGIAVDHIILDPGVGFGSGAEDDWAVLADIAALTDTGHRVLVGASRKRFLATPGDSPADRDPAAAAVTAWCAERGVWAVRVHSVGIHRQAIRVIRRLAGERA